MKIDSHRVAISLMITALLLGGWRAETSHAGQNAAPAAKTLYQQALHEEEATGNLKAAITLYERVLSAKPDRALAAQTLIRMADCYLKLGDAEAQKIYERIVKEYADQKDVVEQARARLGASHSNLGVVTRQAWAGHLAEAVSPDGRYLSYADEQTGDLALHDLQSGTDLRLTKNEQAYEAQVLTSIFSPDGKQLIFTWLLGDDSEELRSIDVNPNGPGRVLYRNEEIGGITAEDLSMDGKWIAALLTRKDGTMQIALISRADSSLRVLKSIPWRASSRMSFSPDGRYLAFDLPRDANSSQSDIVILTTDGSREVSAIRDASNDNLIGWALNGKHLIFSSDRGGSLGIWSIAFDGGTAQGAPELIKPDLGAGRFQFLGFTRSGDLYLGEQTGGPDLYSARVDFKAGTLLEPSVRAVRKFIGTRSEPDWSPDGKYLSYVSDRDGFGQFASPSGSRTTLVIQSLDTGQIRELNPNLSYFHWPQWSPDSQSFIAEGKDFKNRQGIWQIDARSGNATAVMLDLHGDASIPQWALDGKRIFYRRCSPALPDCAIVERNLTTGTEREIVRGKEFRSFSVSPDNQSLAIAITEANRDSVLSVVPVSGGESRELVRLKAPALISNGNNPTNHNVTWTRDGRFVLFHKMGESGIWSAPVEGSPIRHIELEAGPSRGIHVHPDGEQSVFIVANNVRRDVFVMQNLQSAIDKKK